jgi:uncharacterized membrane protein HdeD (DUF308 family)
MHLGDRTHKLHLDHYSISKERSVMNSHTPENVEQAAEQAARTDRAVACQQMASELSHLRLQWCWLFFLGLLLAVCGTAALIFPALTIITSFAAVVILGATLMVAGIATLVTAFWAGRWSGTLLHLLVGILYVVAGFVIADHPGPAAVAMTAFVAALFIVAGAFRMVAALVVRFPHWGWALLNGIVTFLIGIIIYRHFPNSALWVLGVLVGVEMLFHGWTWIVLSLAVRRLPAQTV